MKVQVYEISNKEYPLLNNKFDYNNLYLFYNYITMYLLLNDFCKSKELVNINIEDMYFNSIMVNNNDRNLSEKIIAYLIPLTDYQTFSYALEAFSCHITHAFNNIRLVKYNKIYISVNIVSKTTTHLIIKAIK